MIVSWSFYTLGLWRIDNGRLGLTLFSTLASPWWGCRTGFLWGAGSWVVRARSGPKGLAAGTAAPTATQGHLCRAVCHNRTIACGTVLLASPSACATVTIAAAPSAATTTSPAWLGTGGAVAGHCWARWHYKKKVKKTIRSRESLHLWKLYCVTVVSKYMVSRYLYLQMFIAMNQRSSLRS